MFYRGVVYSDNFNILVLLITVVTAFIIMTISANLVLSLGMVGALSIVRFRSAIKDPIFGEAAARAVASGECEYGIVVCTTGIGISIAANKVKGIRCAHCADTLEAQLCRQHNNANMMAIGAGFTGPKLAAAMVETFLSTAFEGGRHARRVALMDAIEG